LKISYRLRAPLLALKWEGSERPNLENLPPGVVLTLASEVRDSGLVDVTCRDNTYTVFFADVRERSEMAAGNGAG